MGTPDRIVRAIVAPVEALAVGGVMRRRTFCHVICDTGAGTRGKPMRYRDAGNRRPSLPGVTRSRCANSSYSSDSSGVGSRGSGGLPFWPNEANGQKLNACNAIPAGFHFFNVKDGVRLHVLRKTGVRPGSNLVGML